MLKTFLPETASKTSNKSISTVTSVTCVCISDTHNQHWKLPALPPGDILLHAGNFTCGGSQKEILDFNCWLGQQKHTYKIVIPGNHDLGFEDDWNWACGLLSSATHVLKDSACEVLGKKFWGSPWTPFFNDWAFGYTDREGSCRWRQIPTGLNVLVTHGPIQGVLDAVPVYVQGIPVGEEHLGCFHLRDVVINHARPRFHVAGHIHEEHGALTQDNITFVNASCVGPGNKLDPEKQVIVLNL